ncbi:STAS domain-containing protein [Halobacillus sp. Marseille-Q1614]|uniref:STAS domain-containing protein n=1 Tax=Halobacillus sp. Marseille-Q1614 TaxID=2709134 RepID=UPI00157099C5|nr:STAS domain-containing protein [Halobacillus sp. Marseille-Q1614]
MKEELKYIGAKIIGNRLKLAEQLTDVETDSYARSLDREDLSREQILQFRSEIFQYLGESLTDDYHLVERKVIQWAKQVGEVSVESNIPLDDAIAVIGHYRTVVWGTFDEELDSKQFHAITILDVNKFINPLIDQIILQLSQIYIAHHDQRMKRTQDRLKEISVPVVPIADGVAVLPVVGEIDPDRAQLIMETTLQKSTRLQLQYLIIDISGVPVIDKPVIHSLFQVTHSLQLVGVETTLTGIRAEIARSIVEQGMEFREVKTRANLQQALAEIGV